MAVTGEGAIWLAKQLVKVRELQHGMAQKWRLIELPVKIPLNQKNKPRKQFQI
ncbi:MAG: hypothetical protein ACJA1I_000177 [Zhongshania marina]